MREFCGRTNTFALGIKKKRNTQKKLKLDLLKFYTVPYQKRIWRLRWNAILLNPEG